MPKESSVIFSLKELEKIEEERIAQEKQVELERIRQADIARALAFARQREEERDLAVRIAEAKARVEAEAAIAYRIANESRPLPPTPALEPPPPPPVTTRSALPKPVVALMAGLLGLLVIVSVLWRQSADEADGFSSLLVAQAERFRLELEKRDSEISKKDRKIRDLEDEVDGNVTLSPSSPDNKGSSFKSGTNRSQENRPPPRFPCKCDPGDPLCSCL